MLRNDLSGMGEEPLIVHIHSITDTRLGYCIVMNCVINLGFSDLPFGPIWEKGLRISRPASVAFFRAMATALWDRRLSGFELLGVHFCKTYKYNDYDQYMWAGTPTVVNVNPWPWSRRRSMSMGGIWYSI